MKATIYTTWTACPTVTNSEEESQMKYRYLFVLLKVKSDWVIDKKNILYFFLCQSIRAQLFYEASAE